MLVVVKIKANRQILLLDMSQYWTIIDTICINLPASNAFCLRFLKTESTNTGVSPTVYSEMSRRVRCSLVIVTAVCHEIALTTLQIPG